MRDLGCQGPKASPSVEGRRGRQERAFHEGHGRKLRRHLPGAQDAFDLVTMSAAPLKRRQESTVPVRVRREVLDGAVDHDVIARRELGALQARGPRVRVARRRELARKEGGARSAVRRCTRVSGDETVKLRRLGSRDRDLRRQRFDASWAGRKRRGGHRRNEIAKPLAHARSGQAYAHGEEWDRDSHR